MRFETLKRKIPPHQKHSYFITTLDMLTQFRRILIKLKTNLWKRENVTKDSEDEDVWAALEGPGWYDIWGIHSTYVQPAIHMPRCGGHWQKSSIIFSWLFPRPHKWNSQWNPKRLIGTSVRASSEVRVLWVISELLAMLRKRFILSCDKKIYIYSAVTKRTIFLVAVKWKEKDEWPTGKFSNFEIFLKYV